VTTQIDITDTIRKHRLVVECETMFIRDLATAFAMTGNTTVATQLCGFAQRLDDAEEELQDLWAKFLSDNFQANDRAFRETVLALSPVTS